MRAAGWLLFGHGLMQVLRLGSNLILTRLLAPELYGVMAVGYVVMTGLHMFSDIGLNAGATRSARGDEPTFLNVGWVMQIGRGVLVMIASLALAAGLKFASDVDWLPATSVYADPRVPPLVAVISVSALIEGFESTKAWWARRRLSLATFVKIQVTSQLSGTIFVLVWAWISPTVWALAGGLIFGALVQTVLTHAILPGPANRFEWERAAFQEILLFGKWVFLSSSFTFLLANGDRLMLGGMLDGRSMGFYTIALLITGAIQTAVGRVVGYTVLPALSEVFRDRPADLRKTIYRIRKPLDLVCLLVSGALVMLGEPIIGLLYDPRYEPAGWMLSVLTLTLVATRTDVFDQCLIAAGRVKLLSVLNGIRLVTLCCLVPAGYLLQGTHGAVVAVAASSLVNMLAALTLQHRLGLLDLRCELLALPIFTVGLLVGWAVAFVLRHAV